VNSQRRLVVWALLLGAVLYSAWLLGPFLDPDSRSMSSYVSEVAALGRPHSTLFRSLDFICGAVVLAAAAAGIRYSPPRSLTLIGWCAVLLFAASTIADSLLPLSCAPHSDPVCAANEASGDVPLTHQLHLVSSAMSAFAAVVAAPAFTLAAYRYSNHRALQRTGVWVTALLWTSTLAILGALLLGESGHAAAIGLIQRVQLLMIAIGLFYVAGFVHYLRRDSETAG
jgi:hypothetical protein